MIKIEAKSNKALSFILGLVYGYKNADLELYVKDIKTFSHEFHREDKVYYINRRSGEVFEAFCDKVTHVCALREDKINKKVVLFVYKNTIK